MSEMFTCPDCGVRIPADETFEIRHHGRTDRRVRTCKDCRSCSWCGETYDRANPCYTWARILAPEGNPDGSICVQCYAYTKRRNLSHCERVSRLRTFSPHVERGINSQDRRIQYPR